MTENKKVYFNNSKICYFCGNLRDCKKTKYPDSTCEMWVEKKK